ncbi:bifunctional transcriptional activator/DNA repair enzyme AdaA [Grimontia sp. NTOU-MAR1]|uniref:bifunctional transcriptional activator/DNA repair enzyme AdaA n=1 Tax=Grimontia sp. NTOU-MAR1 TaxID=3111011 RepID=UPI002DBEA38C|nr:AlkA N-terminal domain-containing protein [Grimontia sp. NTOU-MAR1]WRV99989.1 AlkA N-terminal domain-containing protein [Grimontia sp. NTOU-MAR1]
MTDTTTYKQARLSRDARFDGLFFIGVVSTGIYCRPICPAPSPKEENVRYYSSAIEAAAQGFRPCLRCRPDSAPGSPAWMGKETTFRRALSFINEGYLHEHSVPELAERLGVSDRYLRKLFTESLGCSPKQYALYQQILFAKKLLHESQLSVTDIAFASGFNSVRRFNDCFLQQLSLSPTQVRRKELKSHEAMTLSMSFRPPYNWAAFKRFMAPRMISGLEWLTDTSYGRRFVHQGQQGSFTATLQKDKNAFLVVIDTEDPKLLFQVVNRIRYLLDLDANPEVIDDALKNNSSYECSNGIRIPGCWDMEEAGVRAYSGETLSTSHSPASHINSFLDSTESSQASFQEHWSAICKRFKHESWPETSPSVHLSQAQYAYARLRGLSLPDISDLDLFNADLTTSAKPWRSYLALAFNDINALSQANTVLGNE